MDEPKSKPSILLVGFGPNIDRFPKLRHKTYTQYRDDIMSILKKHGYPVIETTNIVVSGEGTSLLDARRWISRNALRRKLHIGEKVKVICVIEGKISNDDIKLVDASWVEIMRLLFEEESFKKKQSPFVAAIMHDEGIPSKFEHLKEFFLGLDTPNIIVETTNNNCVPSFSNDSLSIVLKTVNDACVPYLECIIDKLEPFELKTRSCIVEKDIKAWSSEKVILFGRTGSGKSTIAQMLTRGQLNASGSGDKLEDSSSNISDPFKASSDARGVTRDIEIGEGRGWHVTDTPGFGEAKEGSTVSTEQATKIIKKFVRDTCGIYSHYLYVVKKDRMNLYDERLWKFFNEVFAGAEKNFSVVVTGCTMELNLGDQVSLERIFNGCENIIDVDFPSVSDDSELEEENVGARQDALQKLENYLEMLGFADKMTSGGEYSTESLRLVKSNRPDSHRWNAMLDGIGQLQNYVGNVVKEKFLKSKIDEDFILLPL